jgi:putative MATE family efflux protein
MNSLNKKEENIMLENPTRFKLLNTPINKLIKENAIPAVLSMLFMAFYQIVDGIMVGQRLGSDAIGAVNILYPIFAFMAGIGIMIGVGGNAKIAVLLGSDHHKKAGRILSLIVLLGALLGITLSILNVIFMSDILQFLSFSSENLGGLAGEYLIGFIPFYGLMLITFILEQSIRNDGKPNLSSMVMVMCALLNIGLDYVFLYVFNLGIIGASLASGLSQSVGALIFLSYFIIKTIKKETGLVFCQPDYSRSTLTSIFTNGSSELLNNLSVGLTTLLFNTMILSYVGEKGVSAFALVQYLLMLGFFIVIGIGNGCQPIYSYNYGAKKFVRSKKALINSTIIASTVGVILFVAISFWAEPLTMLFIKDEYSVVILSVEIAMFMRWSMLFMPFVVIVSMYFTAIEKAKNSLIIALLRGLILPIAGLLTLPVVIGTKGIWMTPFISESITLIVTIVLLLQVFHLEGMKADSSDQLHVSY